MERDQPRLYADLADLWPLLMPPEAYAAEARQILHLARRFARRPLRSTLHLGCGGGGLDYQLKRRSRVTGVDISPRMLELARALNPEATYQQADLRTLRLAERFDLVVTGDAIEYMSSKADLRAAFETAAAHLHPGGVLVTCAETSRETFIQNASSSATAQAGGVWVAYLENRFDVDPTDTAYQATYTFVIHEGGRTRVETDQHTLGLFPLEEWQRQLQAAGLRVHLHEDQQGLVWFCGVREV